MNRANTALSAFFFYLFYVHMGVSRIRQLISTAHGWMCEHSVMEKQKTKNYVSVQTMLEKIWKMINIWLDDQIEALLRFYLLHPTVLCVGGTRTKWIWNKLKKPQNAQLSPTWWYYSLDSFDIYVVTSHIFWIWFGLVCIFFIALSMIDHMNWKINK